MADRERENLEKRSVSLRHSHWEWLEERASRTGSESQSAEIRGLILAEMARELRDTRELEAVA